MGKAVIKAWIRASTTGQVTKQEYDIYTKVKPMTVDGAEAWLVAHKRRYALPFYPPHGIVKLLSGKPIRKETRASSRGRRRKKPKRSIIVSHGSRRRLLFTGHRRRQF